jgi:tetratricopeptide (TPR) repeat protein
MLRRMFMLGTAAALSTGVLAGSLFDAERPGDGRRRLAPEMVADMAIVAEKYRRAYRYAPASKLLPLAHGHLELALALRPACQPPAVRHALISIAGEMAALAAGTLALDLGHYLQAGPYLDLAAHAAHATGSAELEAVVLAGRSLVLANGFGQHKVALEVAELACDVSAGGVHPTTRAWVAAVCSERLAVLGEETRCRTRLDTSRHALSAARDGDVPWQGIGAFDAAKLDAYEGGDLNRLGRHDEAAKVLDAALTRFGPTMRRHRCTALIDRAEVRLAIGTVDGACADASEALQISADTQHVESLRRVEKLSRAALATRADCARRLFHQVLESKSETSAALEGDA